MNVLLVERDADWRQLANTTHLVGHAMLVLAQQEDETHDAFWARIRRRIGRLKQQALNSVALLRGGQDPRSSEALLRELRTLGPAEVRIFPAIAARGEPGDALVPAATSGAIVASAHALRRAHPGLRAQAA